MNPINLSLDMPISGNCDNFNCCLPKRHSKKNKTRKELKVQDIATKTFEKTESAEKTT